MSQFVSPHFLAGVALLLMCADFFTGALKSDIGRVRVFHALFAGVLLLIGLVSFSAAAGYLPSNPEGHPFWSGIVVTFVGAALLVYQLYRRIDSNWNLGWKYSCVVYAFIMLSGAASLVS